MMNSGELTTLGDHVDDGIDKATSHENEDDTSDMKDGSALTDTSVGPADKHVPTKDQTLIEQPTPPLQ